MKPEYEVLRSELIAFERSHIVNEYELDDEHILRGRCLAFAKAFHERFPHLTIVLGFYNGQEHAWLTEADGTIVDPTVGQFRSNGSGGYSPVSERKHMMKVGCCPNCGSDIMAFEGDDVRADGFCSEECMSSFARYLLREAAKPRSKL